MTNQNSIQEEIKCRLKVGNSYYCSAQTPLSSRHLSKDLKIKIYKTIIMPVVLPPLLSNFALEYAIVKVRN